MLQIGWNFGHLAIFSARDLVNTLRNSFANWFDLLVSLRRCWNPTAPLGSVWGIGPQTGITVSPVGLSLETPHGDNKRL